MRLLVLSFSLVLLLPVRAQYNIERLLTIGRSALYYEDYVLSIHYFNQAISAKPYLYEPWFFRGVAKYYLDDFAGAERDCSEAIQRNPYVVGCYELRGLCLIQQKRYSEAVADYVKALRYDPENQNLWHNRVLCHINNKDYDTALGVLDTMLTRWSKYARGYNMRAEVYIMQKDTASAVAMLDKSLELDPYDGQTWAARSVISLARSEWEESEQFLDKAIHLLPKHSGNYINRAMARFNQNNLRGAMADYDTALDLEPNNFLGHYNRGLLRAQVGDDNRAITDFDFVLRLEPDNLMALYNRALLLDQTGDLRGAIRDYSKVIEQFPNFWTGLQNRASCYRRLGMVRQAEADEFRVFKARLYKHLYGTQPRLNKKQMRKRSDDENIDKYNQLVMADEQEMEQEYQSDYRGRVQNRKVEETFMPMYELSLERSSSDVKSNVLFDRALDELNEHSRLRPLYINTRQPVLDEKKSAQYFALLDSLSKAIDRSHDMAHVASLLMHRAVVYASIQNFDNAIDDLSTYLQMDSTSVLALWQRAVCQSKINSFNASQGTNIDLKTANVLGDLNQALKQAPSHAYLLYNRGNLYAQRLNYAAAIEDYTRAIELDAQLAEAYYNRGLARLYTKQTEEGISDLSKAGELGLYTAYSVIKKYRK